MESKGYADIWTLGYYLERENTMDPKAKTAPINLLFSDIDITQIPEEALLQYVRYVEGVDRINITDKKFNSRFTCRPIAISHLSSGCQTVLYILHIYHNPREYPSLVCVDLTDAGPSALAASLEILSLTSKIVGVVTIPMEPAGDMRDYKICLNDSGYIQNWNDVYIECLNEGESSFKEGDM